MKNSSIYTLIISAFLVNSIFAQEPVFEKSGEFHFEHGECISPIDRQRFFKRSKENIANYNIKLPKNKTIFIQYIWPVVQNPSYDYNSTYGVSNYVDHDPTFPNMLEDYNCGTQTYDLASGYNHTGIDIFLWPFYQNQVHRNQSWAVAAAAGIIIDKQDGNKDDNCTINSNPANYVILEHIDGSRTVYFHLKKHHLTSKSIGASVIEGEYLGVIASSGSSTGPHLHFECYDPSLNLIDPYAGPCNNLNSTSHWVNQKPYWEPTINAALTHHIPPSFNTCPALDEMNLQDEFDQGDLIVFGGYYHDFLSTSNGFCFVKDPGGSTWQSWVFSIGSDLRATYEHRAFVLPSNAMVGTWTYQIILDGVIVNKTFKVNTCNSTEVLSGIQSTNLDIEANYLIQSTQTITGASTHVDYDSDQKIILKPGFSANTGTLFHAFINGCGGI